MPLKGSPRAKIKNLAPQKSVLAFDENRYPCHKDFSGWFPLTWWLAFHHDRGILRMQRSP